jgi:Flp pilus assembly protein TadG
LFRDGGRAYLGRVARAVQRERGQASVETVALVPVLVLLTVATWQAALAGWALVSAQSAARAAARAALAGAPARPAALAALPDGMRRGASTRIADGRVTVRVHIPAVLPGFAFDVSASAQAARQ